MQYVIIGNSIAAVGCIDGIRRATRTALSLWWAGSRTMCIPAP